MQTRAIYHVPYSQVWEGSRGRQEGRVHLHVPVGFVSGRLKRPQGGAICPAKGTWYGREDQLMGDCPNLPCMRCVDLAKRYNLEWPESYDPDKALQGRMEWDRKMREWRLVKRAMQLATTSVVDKRVVAPREEVWLKPSGFVCPSCLRLLALCDRCKGGS